MLYEMNDKRLTGIERTSFQEQDVMEAALAGGACGSILNSLRMGYS